MLLWFSRLRSVDGLRQPIRGFGRLWLASLLCFSAFYGGTQALARVLRDGGYLPGEVGLVLGAFGAAALLARPLAGWLSDRVAPRWILGGGALALAVGLGGLAWATTTASLMALRVLQALGYAAFTTAGTTVVAGLGPAVNRAGRMARYGMAANVAMALAPAVLSAGLPADAPGFAIGLGLVALLAGLSAQIPGSADGQRPDRRVAWSAVIRSIGAGPWGLAVGVGLGFGVFLNYAPLLTDPATDVLFGAYGVTILAARILGGRWLDRTPLAPVVRWGGAGLVLGMVELALGGPHALVGAALIGAAGGVLHPAALAAAIQRAPTTPGQATGWSYFGFDLGLTLSGWALGPALGLGGPAAVFGVAAGALALVIIGIGGKHA